MQCPTKYLVLVAKRMTQMIFFQTHYGLERLKSYKNIFEKGYLYKAKSRYEGKFSMRMTLITTLTSMFEKQNRFCEENIKQKCIIMKRIILSFYLTI